MENYFLPYGPDSHPRMPTVSTGPEKYVLMLDDEVQIKQDGPYYNMRGTVGGLRLPFR